MQPLVPTLYVASGTIGTNNAVAAFDLDGTLVRTVRTIPGRSHKDANDWAFLPNRISIMKSYRDAGYTLAIFTNQAYAGVKLTVAINRVTNIVIALNQEGLHPFVLASVAKDNYRKPNTGMWSVLTQSIPNIDMTKSFYVGDAAGRPGDHSADDIGLAQNVGLTFYTPEQVFPNTEVPIPDTQTMFIFVGMPGAGKSTFYHQKLAPKGWVHANRDTLKTEPKVLATVRQGLATGRSVAIDATNPDPTKRLEYTKLAYQYKVPTMIIYFVGEGYNRNKLRDSPVPDIAYYTYFKNLVEPTPELDYVPVIQVT